MLISLEQLQHFSRTLVRIRVRVLLCGSIELHSFIQITRYDEHWNLYIIFRDTRRLFADLSDSSTSRQTITSWWIENSKCTCEVMNETLRGQHNFDAMINRWNISAYQFQYVELARLGVFSDKRNWNCFLHFRTYRCFKLSRSFFANTIDSNFLINIFCNWKVCLHCDNIPERSRVCSVWVLPTCRAFNCSRMWVSDDDTPFGLQPADRVNSTAAFTYLMRTISAYNCELSAAAVWRLIYSFLNNPFSWRWRFSKVVRLSRHRTQWETSFARRLFKF